MDNIVCGRCSVSQITQLRRCIFAKKLNIFRHLKLEIALAIPASNDEKYNWINSAGQGLTGSIAVIGNEMFNHQDLQMFGIKLNKYE